MLLRGILDQSLGQICIRGFADLGDLEKVSRADLTYQRNLIGMQKKQILKFLNDENPNLFFPEVILSYVIKRDVIGKSSRKTINEPLADIRQGKRFRSNTDDVTFTTKSVLHKSSTDSRGTNTISIVTVDIDESFVNKRPFLRVDGNHRLSAATAYDEIKENEDQEIARERRSKSQRLRGLVTPFCLLLLPEEENSIRFEKVVFHNINAKSIPLTDEEIYRVVVDDEIHFTDNDLKNSPDFGLSYLYTRAIKKRIEPANYPALASLLIDEKNRIEFVRTILMDFLSILKERNNLPSDLPSDRFDAAFREVNQLYTHQPRLSKSQAHGLLVAFLYFAYQRNVFNFDWFTNWVLDNHIYELKKVSSIDLVAIFDKVLLSKQRTIFVSMPFGKSVCDTHFQLVQDIISQINAEKDANIKLEPLRIDQYQNGSSFKIPDEILNKIADSGLLLADLTYTNANVYHEVGYLMGLARERKKPKLNLLLICNTTVTELPREIGFNIRDHKILGFADTRQLKEPLHSELLNFYFKD